MGRYVGTANDRGQNGDPGAANKTEERGPVTNAPFRCEPIRALFPQIECGIIDGYFGQEKLRIAANVNIRRVVFTDLDGTLLDHDTYDWRPAAPVLDRLRQLGIPLVLVSSKTLPELEQHRRALAVDGPVIAENGAVIDAPAGYFSHDVCDALTSVDRATLQRHLRELRDGGNYDCVSFEELGNVGIAAATGLSVAEAEQANQRRASEPIQWNDTAARLQEFIAAAEARGLHCTQGGRFVHLMGPVDKADAVSRL